MTKLDTVRIHILVTLAVMIFIFVHSAMPGEVSGSESRFFAEILSYIAGISFQTAHLIVRKAAHFTEFAVLGICLSVNFNDCKTQNKIWNHPAIAAWAVGTFYACTDEFHQLFVEGRSCEIRDICIDSTGVMLGIAFASYVIYQFRHNITRRNDQTERNNIDERTT